MYKFCSKISFAKSILIIIIFFSVGTVLGVTGYLFIAKPKLVQAPAPQVNAVEISSDGKFILNSETKEVIFTINDAKKFLKNSGYEYNPDTFDTTNAKHEGDCFTDSALSNKKDRIVFSTGCLAGDLPQAWVGISSRIIGFNNYSEYSNPPDIWNEKFEFLIGGSGRNFIWSSDDKTITYEADLGLSEMTETRTIDSQTGEILETKSTLPTTENWQVYRNEQYGFELKYPSEFLLNITQGHVGPGVPGGEYNEVATALHFRTSKNDYLLSILIYTEEQWEKFGKNDYSSTFLGKNNKLVYASEITESDIANQILSTFKFIEQDELSRKPIYSKEVLSDKEILDLLKKFAARPNAANISDNNILIDVLKFNENDISIIEEKIAAVENNLEQRKNYLADAQDARGYLNASTKVCIAKSIVNNDLKHTCGLNDKSSLIPNLKYVDDITAAEEVLPYFLAGISYYEYKNNTKAKYYLNQIELHYQSEINTYGESFLSEYGKIYRDIYNKTLKILSEINN